VSGEGLGSGPALTAAGQTLGTLEYMSPEQLMGAQLDGRSDLYALGILSYEMVTGALPFKAKTPGEMITFHLKTTPIPPSKAAPERNIPPELDQAILKLLAKKREQRYRDTGELRHDLAKLLRAGPATLTPGRGMSAAPVTAMPRADSAKEAPATDRVVSAFDTSSDAPARRGKGTILLVAALVLAVAAAVVAILMFVVK
jgi:serine/threonine-protein kinase